MLENGIVQLVEGNAAVAALAPSGGHLGSYPKNTALPTWVYKFFGDTQVLGLQIKGALSMRRLQIDCFGDGGGTGADAINLAQAIHAVLNGFRGVLSDPDSTYVDNCFRVDLTDFEIDRDARTYRRMSEYRIWYGQQT